MDGYPQALAEEDALRSKGLGTACVARNAQDMLTEGGYSGWLRYSIKARALDTRHWRSESQLPQRCICQAAHSGNGLGGAGDNSPNTQEPCVSKEVRTDLKQRW